MTTEGESRIDGRELRAIKNRQSIIDALVTLAISGVDPSVDEIAQEAGVSVRSIYRHFDNVDDARRIASERIVASVIAQLERASGPLDSERPLVDRCESLVNARFELHDALGHMARSVSRVQPDRPNAQRQYAAAIQMCSDQVAVLFAPEFESMRPADRTMTHALVDALTSFETVDRLLMTDGTERAELGTRLSRQLLTAFGPAPSEPA